MISKVSVIDLSYIDYDDSEILESLVKKILSERIDISIAMMDQTAYSMIVGISITTIKQ
jgi:hypothetical protein